PTPARGCWGGSRLSVGHVAEAVAVINIPRSATAQALKRVPKSNLDASAITQISRPHYDFERTECRDCSDRETEPRHIGRPVKTPGVRRVPHVRVNCGKKPRDDFDLNTHTSQ